MKRRIWTVFLAVFCLCLLSGCGKKQENVFLCRRDAYAEAFLQANPQYRRDGDFVTDNVNFYASVHEGAVAECLYLQVQPALAQGIGREFVHQGLCTVVFAVNEDLTDARPQTWQALLEAEIPVGIPQTPLTDRLLLGAAAYAFEGQNFGKDQALHYYRSLARQGNLRKNDGTCPITICLDIDAVDRIHRGENLTMIVPQDGTLSFLYGLYTSGGVEGLSEEQLLEAGLRLPDGRCTEKAYPPREAYESAGRITDMQHFLDVTHHAVRDFTREVFHTRLLNTADDRELVLSMTTAALLVFFWAASALHRSTSLSMRRWIWMVAGQMLGWLLLYLLKHQLYIDSIFAHICWYGCYIFLMGLPLTIVYIGIAVDMHPWQRNLPLWFRVLAILHPVLVLMVFTNDWHRLVFRFPLSGHWTGSYDFGFVYYLIFAYATTCFLISLYLLIQKSRRSPKRGSAVVPVITAVFLISYLLSYAFRVPVILDSNVPLIFCFFSGLYLEAILHAGLIPTNIGYQKLFSLSPLHMQLLDPEGNTVLKSRGTQPLTDPQRKRILTQPESPFYMEPDRLLHSQQIHGGFAVWQEDVSELNELQEELQDSIQKLKTTNTLLHRQGQIRRQRVITDVKNQLFDHLEAEISEESEEISGLVRSLPTAENRKKLFSYLPMLLCHLKRRCNLFFLAQEGQEMSSNELAVYIDELSEFAAYTDCRALVRCGISRKISVLQGTVCYDFYFQLLKWSIMTSGAVLIGRMEDREEGMVFDVLCSQNGENLEFPEKFLKAVKAAGGYITRKPVEDSMGIYLSFGKEAGL